jgi:hypothetical protein
MVRVYPKPIATSDGGAIFRDGANSNAASDPRRHPEDFKRSCEIQLFDIIKQQNPDVHDCSSSPVLMYYECKGSRHIQF